MQKKKKPWYAQRKKYNAVIVVRSLMADFANRSTGYLDNFVFTTLHPKYSELVSSNMIKRCSVIHPSGSCSVMKLYMQKMIAVAREKFEKLEVTHLRNLTSHVLNPVAENKCKFTLLEYTVASFHRHFNFVLKY